MDPNDDDDDVVVLEWEGSQRSTTGVASTAGDDEGNAGMKDSPYTAGEDGMNGGVKDSPAIAKCLFESENDDDDDDVVVLEREESHGATTHVAATPGTDSGNGDIKESIAIAKSLFVLEEWPLKKARGNKSHVWILMKAFKPLNDAQLEILKANDEAAFNKVEQGIHSKRNHAICLPCFDNASKKICDCLLMPSFSKASNKLDSTGNLDKHLKRHQDVYPSCKQPGYVYTRPTGVATEDETASQALTISSSTVVPAKSIFIDKHFKGFFESGSKKLQKGLDKLVLEFADNNNIARRVVADHSACPEFKRILLYCIDNAVGLKKLPDPIPGLARFDACRREQYEQLLAGVAWYVGVTRTFFTETLKKEIPFLTVAHDIWDSTKKDVLGVTVHFFCPATKTRVKVPVGMLVCNDKNSKAVCEQTLSMLAACGIGKDDIYRAANDTTNSAVKVGRLLSGENGTCSMHQVQLIITHATGRVTRKKNNKIVDSFEECERIRKTSEDCANWIMNRKSKGRYSDYCKNMTEKGRSPRKLIIPNSTRAAGVVLHYESMLKSRWNLDSFCYDHNEARRIEDDTWWEMSHVYSVLYPLMRLIKEVQSDDFGAISYSYFCLFRCFTFYAWRTTYWCIETRKSFTTTVATKWDASARIPARKYTGDPINKGQCSNGRILANISTVGMVNVDTNSDDFSAIAKKLITRIKNEFPKYGLIPTEDRLLSMACNPYTATTLMEDLEDLVDMCAGSDNVDEETKNLAANFKDRAKVVLMAEIRDVCSALIPAENGDAGVNAMEPTASPSGGGDLEEAMMQKRRKRMKLSVPAVNETGDVVLKEVEAFFGQTFDVEKVLAGQTKRPVTLSKAKEIYKNRMNVTGMVKHFDVMEWWETIGKRFYPLIYPVACCILALPDSNGDQERTFSAATWMDGKLNNKQTDLTFQLKVLAYKNSEFLKECRAHVKKEHMEEAGMRAQKLLEKSRSSMKEEGIELDSDAEEIMEAFGINEDEY